MIEQEESQQKGHGKVESREECSIAILPPPSSLPLSLSLSLHGSFSRYMNISQGGGKTRLLLSSRRASVRPSVRPSVRWTVHSWRRQGRRRGS